MTFFAIQNPTYLPAMRLISNITNAPQAVVTTTFDHGYLTGEIVRLNIPSIFGMHEADQLFAPITVNGNTTFIIDINTSRFSAFNAPVQARDKVTAYVTPIGEVNSNLQAAVRNVL